MSRGKKRQEKNATKEKRRKWRWEREERNEERRQKEGILIEGTDKGWKPSFTEWWGCTHITRHLPRIHSVRWVPSIPFISTTPSSGLSGKKSLGRHSATDSHTCGHTQKHKPSQIHTLTDNREKDTLRPGSLFFFFLHTHTGKKKTIIPTCNVSFWRTHRIAHRKKKKKCKQSLQSGQLSQRVCCDHRSRSVPQRLISRLARLCPGSVSQRTECRCVCVCVCVCKKKSTLWEIRSFPLLVER